MSPQHALGRDNGGRRRILFIGWRLGAYGGLETRMAWAARLADDNRFAPEIYVGRPIPPGSQTIERLATVPVTSILGEWERGLRGRTEKAVARAAMRLRGHRRLADAEAAKAGDGRARRLAEQHWRKRGRTVIRGADVVHLFGPPHPFLVSAMDVAHEEGVSVIYQSVHAVTESYATNKWRRGFIDRCNHLDLVLLSHDGAAGDFRQHFHYHGKTVTIGQSAYGIGDELLALPLPSNCPSSQVVIGALCRFDRVKGLDVLIEAFADVAARWPGARLRLGGSGEEEPSLRALAVGLGVADRVEFLGYITDRVAFYRDIDVFVLASRLEGGPVSGVEAMAAARAVVSTPVGAMPDRLDDGSGVLVPNDAPAELADALSQLVADSERRRNLGVGARSRYLECYSEPRQALALVDIWDRLVD